MNKATPRRQISSRLHLGPACRGLYSPGRTCWLAILLLGLLLAGACGQLRPQPAAFDPREYTPIAYQDLLNPGPASLQAGQKVRVQAYFWQYLNYDPAIVRNYLTLPRYPVQWFQLRWFATYGAPDLTGYYDLAAMTPQQADGYKLKRLDPVMLYGELTPLSPGFYLQVFHIEPIAKD